MKRPRKSNPPAILPNDCELGEIAGRLVLAVALLERADQELAVLPSVESAIRAYDVQRFKALSAAEGLLGWLRGFGENDSAENPAGDSALGAYDRINSWTDAEARQFLDAASRDMAERN